MKKHEEITDKTYKCRLNDNDSDDFIRFDGEFDKFDPIYGITMEYNWTEGTIFLSEDDIQDLITHLQGVLAVKRGQRNMVFHEGDSVTCTNSGKHGVVKISGPARFYVKWEDGLGGIYLQDGRKDEDSVAVAVVKGA